MSIQLPSPTLLDLRTEVRALLNQRNPVNSNFSDTDLNNWINEAIRRYYNEVTIHGEGQFTRVVNLDITSDEEEITLPSDTFEIKKLQKRIPDGFITLPYRNNIDEGFSTMGGTSALHYLPFYYFRGNKIVLEPTPNFSEVDSLRLEYIYFPEVLVSDADVMTPQILPIFRDLIIMFAVYKAKLQESLVSNIRTHEVAQGELSALITQFKDAIGMRSRGNQAIRPFNPETDGL